MRPQEFILPIVLAQAVHGSRRLFLWNSNSPYREDPSAKDRTRDWELVADLLPRINAGPQEPTSFERMLAELAKGASFDFRKLLGVLSNWDHAEVPTEP